MTAEQLHRRPVHRNMIGQFLGLVSFIFEDDQFDFLLPAPHIVHKLLRFADRHAGVVSAVKNKQRSYYFRRVVEGRDFIKEFADLL